MVHEFYFFFFTIMRSYEINKKLYVLDWCATFENFMSNVDFIFKI